MLSYRRSTEQLFDPISRDHRILVLPDPDHLPSVVAEDSIDLSVTLLIAPQLALPPLGVGLRLRAVFRTGVPKATVHVDREASRAENDVGAGAETGQRRTIDPKAEPTTVELGTDCELGQSVTATQLRHLGALRQR